MIDRDELLAQQLHRELNGISPPPPSTASGGIGPLQPLPPPSSYRSLPTTTAAETVAPPPEGTKGFDNPIGHNNCFLNVVLQSISHLPLYARALQEASHRCGEPNGCVVCGLRHLMLCQTREQRTSYLDPAEMRRLVQRLIGVGLQEMADAVETFDALICAVHSSCQNKQDPLHSVFGPKGANGLIVSVSDAVKRSPPTPSLASVVNIDLDMRSYVGVLTFQVVWNQMKYLAVQNTQPDILRNDLTVLLEMFPPQLDVGEFFNTAHNQTGVYVESPADVMCNLRTTAKLVSVIAYYGCHYFTYSLVSTTGAWYKFDDRDVKYMGATWDEVRTHMLQGKAQPVLLFYEQRGGLVQKDFVKC